MYWRIEAVRFWNPWGDEKEYRFGNRESTRAFERGFDDFNESEAPTSTRDDVKPNFTRAEGNPMITRDKEKHANTMFQPNGNVYDGYTSSESTTSVYGVKERIMSKKRCYISKSSRNECSTKVDDTPQLLDFGIPRRKELNGPEVAQSERLVENEEPAMFRRLIYAIPYLFSNIIGKCFVNGKPVHFLFDTGTVKTIIADRIWRQCKKIDSRLISNKSTIITCSGGPIEVIGTGKCELQLHNFKGEIEVIVVKKLIYDCLLGLDMAFKLSDIKEYLDRNKAGLGGKTLDVRKKAKTPLKATLPEIYRSQASVNATNFKELPLANGDPEEPAQDEDEKNKVEA
ncbi:hypothetical protein BpHYR1_014612 [Brachionus plicatilis]|uniref:Peptidase A2 domain-containing protein n=1 Tax=Brachionus plicatilis TaxID=10195 RepID=A0A3M7QHS0_BRAPC|nr:hypothetical protein BpHYR1_014612 [Brachionus plicatilis]